MSAPSQPEQPGANEAAAGCGLLLDQLFDTTAAAIWVKDLEGRYLFANRGAEALMGLTADRLLGRSDSDLFPPGQALALRSHDRRALERPSPLVTEETLTLGGEERSFRSETFAVRDAGGRPTAVGAIWVEITGLRRMEEARASTEARLRETQRLAGAYSWEWDALRDALTGSEEMARVFGVERERLRTLADILSRVHPEDRAIVHRTIGQAIAQRGPYSLRCRIVRDDGSSRIVDVRGSVDVDPEGRPRQIAGSAQDVTSAVRAEEDLRRLARQQESILEAAGEGIVGLDPEGRASFLNRSAEQMLGWDPGKLLGQAIHEAIHHDRAHGGSCPGDPCPLAASCLGAKSHSAVGDLFCRKDGTSFRVDYTCNPSESANDQPAGAVLTFRDVEEGVRHDHERRELERERSESKRLESLGKLAGGIAHYFNNSLAVILNYAILAGTDLPAGSRVRDDLGEIRAAAERAAHLTSQLLRFGRRDAVEPRSVDVNAVVTSAERLLRRTLGEDISLVTSLDPNAGSISADAGQLEQVLVNLGANARDAMPGGGTLTIQTVAHGSGADERTNGELPQPSVALIVADDGAGMEPDVAQQAFDPFFTTKPPGKGTGLGLATVYAVVARFGGRVRLESTPGKGTRFELVFPVATRIAERVEEPERTPPSPSRAEVVLVVEDEMAVRRLVERILRRHGYQVLGAALPSDALELCERHPSAPDLLLTDVVMPEFSGFELADRCTTIYPELQVLYMSGYPDASLPERVSREAIDIVEKPFTADQLLQRVGDALARGRAAQPL